MNKIKQTGKAIFEAASFILNLIEAN